MATPRICSIDGCGKRISAKGYCSAHYGRWIRHGDPLAGRTFDGELPKFIETVAIPYEGNDCLTWPYHRNGQGYGRININGKSKNVSNLVCRAVHGEPPTPKHQAAHNCGKGHEGCVNPLHMEWKTVKQNKADMVIHGTRLRGAAAGRAILTEDDVRQIRRMAGTMRHCDIAAMFGVCRTNVTSILNRRHWAWFE